jgi:hypothetical protein
VQSLFTRLILMFVAPPPLPLVVRAQSSKLLIVDGLQIDPQEYAEISARFIADLNDLRKKVVIYFPAHWTIKK